MNLFDYDDKGPREYEHCVICGKSLRGKRPDAMFCTQACVKIASNRRSQLRKVVYKMLDALSVTNDIRLDIETEFLLGKIKEEIYNRKNK